MEGLKPLNSELNPICHLLALVGTHPIFHVSRIRVKLQAILE
jgi:transposase